MKAAYVKVPFTVEIRDIPIPQLACDEVLVRVSACGVCGTDLHNARDLARKEAMPLGHEFCGLIEKTGSGVTDFRPADRVIVENHTALGRSAAAKNGDLAGSTDLYITMNQPCMAEFVKTHVLALHRNPSLSAAAGALAEPLTVALDLVESSDIGLGSKVAVFGAGPIGLMALKLVLLKGAAQAVVVQPSHSKARIALAQKLGAQRIVLSDREDVARSLKEQCPEGFDRILVTAPPSALPAAIEAARFGGIVTFNGISYASPLVSFDANAFHFKRLQLRATHSIPNLRFPMAIALLERKEIDAADFVTHSYPLKEVSQALQTAEHDKAQAIKVIVTLEQAT
jgi:L-iditol 2-dehydrogenase